MLGGCNEMARRADEAFPAKNGHPAMFSFAMDFIMRGEVDGSFLSIP